MKIKKTNRFPSLRLILSYLLIVTLVTVISACRSQELSRSEAQRMIVATSEYQEISTLDYLNRYLKEDKGKGTCEATAADEPEASAVRNRINEYYFEEPRVQIAQHLGLVEPHIKRIGDQLSSHSSRIQFGFWYFDEKWTNTPQGEKLWTDYGLPVQETTVPLAKREFGEVTGVTKLGESERGVDFTWRWVPNQLGKALDPSTAEFESLPENMRTNLTANVYKMIPRFTYGWSGERTGRATFRKFDDGWRLQSVSF